MPSTGQRAVPRASPDSIGNPNRRRSHPDSARQGPMGTGTYCTGCDEVLSIGGSRQVVRSAATIPLQARRHQPNHE